MTSSGEGESSDMLSPNPCHWEERMPDPSDLSDLSDMVTDPAVPTQAPQRPQPTDREPTAAELEAQGAKVVSASVGDFGVMGLTDQSYAKLDATRDSRYWPLLAYLRQRCYPHCRDVSPEQLTAELLHVVNSISR